MRYVSSMEACWRLFNFVMHDRSHSIYRMVAHLPNQQNIVLAENNPDSINQEMIDRLGNKLTMLTGWFLLNQKDVNARQYLYSEIGNYYVWNKLKRSWTPRQKGADKILSRIYNVNPRCGELYFLRVLLLHVPGATSFEFLRTYNDQVFDTFKEACLARGLLADDQEWYRAMDQASKYQMPRQLRLLFVNIITSQTVNNTHDLFDRYKQQMWEDIAKKRNITNRNELEQLLLAYLERLLHLFNTNLTEKGLPEANPQIVQTLIMLNELEIRTSRFTTEEHAQFFRQRDGTLNPEQQIIFDTIIKAIEDMDQNLETRSRCFFVNGLGGSGKTYTFEVQ